jgi:hypothetical protein
VLRAPGAAVEEAPWRRRTRRHGQRASGPRPDGSELTDEQLDKVSGGFTSVSNVLKLRHDTAKNSISNIR